MVFHAGRRHYGQIQMDQLVQQMVLRRFRRRHVQKPLHPGRLLGQRFRRVGEITLNPKFKEAGVGTLASFLSL